MHRGVAAGCPCVEEQVLDAAADELCDADDLFLPDKLERQLARFVARRDLDVSLCTAEYFWEEGLEEERARYEEAGRTSATHSFGTLVARRQAFDRVGMVDESPGRGEQIDWFARLAETDLVVEILPDVLARRRMHPGSWSHRDPGLDGYFDFYRRRVRERTGR